MPNLLAYLVMFLWPVVVIVTFNQRRGRSSPARTTAWMMFLAIMFLPSSMSLDAPLIPPMNKCAITSVAVSVALQLFHRNELLKRAPLHWMPRLILVLVCYAAYQTTVTNGDPLQFGPLGLPGMVPGDVVSLWFESLFELYLPFSIGQRVFRTERDLRDLFDVLARCFVIYTPFVLWELRMAPVLHEKFYGYASFSFQQAIRAGGYRPAVFMAHGLALAMFTFIAYTAIRGLSAARIPTRPLSSGWLVVLSTVMLVLCKTLAAVIYGVIAWFFIGKKVRTTLLSVFLVVVAAAVAAYPSMRIDGSFPTYKFIELAAGASGDRAESLEFRFDNEDMLLVRGLERPMYGWGGYGRQRIYDEMGRNVSVTDGLWIIWFGSRGFAGLVLNLTIILLPLLRAAWNMRKIRGRSLYFVAALAIISACLSVDLLPNARFDNSATVLGGVLWTVSESLIHRARRGAEAVRPRRTKAKTEPEPEPQPEPEAVPT